MSTIVVGADRKSRCQWCNASGDYRNYHDNEWGYPVSDDQHLFEKICLEGFQSGLSWRTVLTKRDNFRKAFKQFDVHKVARFTEKDINRLLQNEGIIRHRGKIEATVNNAKRAKEMIKQEGSLATFFWRYEPEWKTRKPQTVATSEESIAISKELKKRGWKFVGPTTMYAFMQAMGLVNDHAEMCSFRMKAIKARETFSKPYSAYPK